MSDTNRTIHSATDAYHFVRELGSGGQGRTWLALRERDSLVCVVKELHLDKVADWKAVEHFEREIGALSSLSHRGIPAFIDRATDGEGHTQALIQEYIEGLTLDEQIRRGPLSPERFEQALRDLLEIASHLHSRVPPLVHRDIQPRNIVLGNDRAYLVDFGVATWSQVTNATAVGTFGYVAPEQLLGRAEPASDLYSIGMTFLAAANARDAADFPISPDTGQVDVAQLVRSVPARARRVLLALTRPGLGQRVSSADDALELLRRGEEPARQSAESKALQHRAAPAPADQRSARQMLAAGVAVALVAMGGVMSLLVVKNEEPEFADVSPTMAAESVVQSSMPADYPSEPTQRPVVSQNPPPRLPPTPTLGDYQVGPDGVVSFEGGDASLTVNSIPGSADVVIGQATVCQTPCTLVVPYGLHTLELVLGERRIARQVRVNDDATLAVTFPQ